MRRRYMELAVVTIVVSLFLSSILISLGGVGPAISAVLGQDSTDHADTNTTTTQTTTTTKPIPDTPRLDPDNPKTDTGVLSMDGVNRTVNSSKIEHYIYLEINEVREEHGLAPWNYSERVSSVARAHAAWMTKPEGYFAHKNSQGEVAYDRWTSISPNRCSKVVGENIVIVTIDDDTNISEVDNINKHIAEKAVRKWMHSKPHRELILSDKSIRPYFNYIGVGVQFRTNPMGAVMAVMNVCGPSSPERPPQNDTTTTQESLSVEASVRR